MYNDSLLITVVVVIVVITVSRNHTYAHEHAKFVIDILIKVGIALNFKLIDRIH